MTPTDATLRAPAWAVRALCKRLYRHMKHLETAWDPSGASTDTLAERFGRSIPADETPLPLTINWVIVGIAANPDRFLPLIKSTMARNYAMFAETATIADVRQLDRQPTSVLQLAEPVRGRPCCWLVWDHMDMSPPATRTVFEWLPPCREELERPECAA